MAKPWKLFLFHLFILVNYGQVWCSKFRDEYLVTRILNGHHSPGEFRVIGPTSNSEDFAKTFQCKPNQKNNPANKCSVWQTSTIVSLTLNFNTHINYKIFVKLFFSCRFIYSSLIFKLSDLMNETNFEKKIYLFLFTYSQINRRRHPFLYIMLGIRIGY